MIFCLSTFESRDLPRKMIADKRFSILENLKKSFERLINTSTNNICFEQDKSYLPLIYLAVAPEALE